LFFVCFYRKLDALQIPDNKIKTLTDKNRHLSQMRDSNKMVDSMLCKICYKEEMKVAFVPCGHVVSCIQCALTIDKCALCRHPISMAMRVYLSSDEENDKDLEAIPCSSSQCFDEQLDPMLCKVCRKEEMVVAFLPCRHIYACVKCAEEMHECLVCAEKVCSFIPLYL